MGSAQSLIEKTQCKICAGPLKGGLSGTDAVLCEGRPVDGKCARCGQTYKVVNRSVEYARLPITRLQVRPYENTVDSKMSYGTHQEYVHRLQTSVRSSLLSSCPFTSSSSSSSSCSSSSSSCASSSSSSSRPASISQAIRSVSPRSASVAPELASPLIIHPPSSTSFSASSSSSSIPSSSSYQPPVPSSLPSTGRIVSLGDRVLLDSGVLVQVVSCHPPAGVFTASTQVIVGPHLHPLVPARRVHILPTHASLLAAKTSISNSDEMMAKYIGPYFRSSPPSATSSTPSRNHIFQGASFVSEGVEFIVVSCEPENGLITGETEIFTEGPPILDLARLSILPIETTLPREDRTIRGEATILKYLHPFFSGVGRTQRIEDGQTIQIDNVNFRVTACEPPVGGLVTSGTTLYTDTPPLSVFDLDRLSEEKDLRLAREMQQQEMRALDPFQIFLQSRGAGGGLPQFMMNQNRVQVDPMDFFSLIFRNSNMFMNGQFDPERRFGSPPADTQVVKSLKRVTIDQTHKDKSAACSVCLSDFELGEMDIVELPCSHLFHEPCIKPWLDEHCSCPTCRYELKSADPEFERAKAQARQRQEESKSRREERKSSRTSRHSSRSRHSSSSSRTERKTSRSSAPSTNTPVVGVPLEDDAEPIQWQCFACTFINTEPTGLCAACQTFNPDAFALFHPGLAPSFMPSTGAPLPIAPVSSVITRQDIQAELKSKDVDASGDSWSNEDLVEVFVEALETRDMLRLLRERNILIEPNIEKEQLAEKVKSIISL